MGCLERDPMDGKELEVDQDARVSERVFNLMKNTDLENASWYWSISLGWQWLVNGRA